MATDLVLAFFERAGFFLVLVLGMVVGERNPGTASRRLDVDHMQNHRPTKGFHASLSTLIVQIRCIRRLDTRPRSGYPSPARGNRAWRFHMETTLIILKPDALQRGLMGRIISRFEDKGLQVVAAKLMKISQELAGRHYESHEGKPFYDGLVSFMTSSPVLVLALRGIDAITISRGMMGATFGSKAEPGTIRGDFGVSNSFNLIHGSDSPEAAERELGLFFASGEIQEWPRAIEGWVYDCSGDTPE